MNRLFYIIVPILLVGAYFQIKPDVQGSLPDPVANKNTFSRLQNLENQIADHAVRRALPYVQQSERQLEFAERAKEAFLTRKGEKFEAFTAYVAEMPEEFIGVLSTELNTFFSSDDDEAQQWLFALTDGLAKLGRQERALDLTSYLQTQDKIPDVERKLLYDWSAESWKDVFSLYDHWAKNSNFVDGRQVSILASLNVNERSDHQEDFMNWVSGLNDPAYHKLQAALIEKMALHAKRDDESYHEVINLFEDQLEENPRLAEKLPNLALGYSPDDPQKALEWISQVKTSDDEMRQLAFAHVMQEMVLNDVDRAAEFLSAENFLTNYYVSENHTSAYDDAGEVKPEAQNFYDTTLRAFMQGILSVDPHIVLDSVDAFFSDDLRDEFRKQANEYLKELQNGNVRISGHQCNSPNCTHEHH